MTRAYNVVDADGHILEPLDLWDRHMDPAFRDRAPRVVKDNETGKERLVIEEHTSDARINIGRIGAVGARQGIVEPDGVAYKDGKPGGFDPHARIPDMDADGIDAAFLYPSLGPFSGAIHDPQLAAAVCRAYNRWLADYCSAYPDRLFGVAMPLSLERGRLRAGRSGRRFLDSHFSRALRRVPPRPSPSTFRKAYRVQPPGIDGPDPVKLALADRPALLQAKEVCVGLTSPRNAREPAYRLPQIDTGQASLAYSQGVIPRPTV